MHYWGINNAPANPPHVNGIPTKLVHIRQYTLDMAYIPPYTKDETRKKFKRRIYDTLLRIEEVQHRATDIRIINKNPGIPWMRVWKNLHAAPITDKVKSIWYMAIHDIIPTKNRLAAIRMAPSDSCARCGKPDSLLHTITECTEAKIVWNWVRTRLGVILGMNPRNIPSDWLIRPAFRVWPQQRQTATLWILAHVVYYNLQSHRRLSLTDFLDFLKRARWKTYHSLGPPPDTGSYLENL